MAVHRKKKKEAQWTGGIPAEILKRLNEEGLQTDGFLHSVTGDMDNEGQYAKAWVAFDTDGLYIAVGRAAVEQRRGKKRLQTRYRLDSLRTVPAAEIDELDIEQYVSTCRLLVKKDGEPEPVLRFSIGLKSAFHNLVKLFNAMKKGEDLAPLRAQFAASPHCPVCGMRYPDPERKLCPKCMDKRSTIRRLFAFFGGYKWQVAVILGFILLNTGISVLLPQISTRTLYDTVLNTGNTTPVEELIVTLGWLVLTIAGIRLFNLGMEIVHKYVVSSVLPWVIYDIMLKIFRAMQRLSVGFYTSKQTGSLMERVTSDANNIYWFFVDGLPYVISSTLTIVGVLGVMFWMNWRLTLIAFVSIPVVVVIFRLLDGMWHRLHHRRWAYNASLNNLISDNINGQRVIKAFSQEEREQDRFGTLSGRLKNADIKLANTEGTTYPLLFLFVSLITTVILMVGGIDVVNGRMGFGTLMTFIIYIEMLHNPLDFLSWVSNWWARCVDSAHRVFEIIDTEPEIAERENPVVLPEVHGAIEIRELEFEYEPARPVIKRLNLSVPAGTMLGIVGKTGAGKTTIANLIARLYDAKSGDIRIDGVDVRDLSLQQIRRNVGLVSQDIYLFMGTIADNIRYARPEATMDEVVAAAKAASAHAFIMRLPDTYETRIGAGGQDLSGGERQRLSIARTIIQNPKILILDEATAAMDTETERNIQESLNRLKTGRTTIAIAHRLSTLRDADYLAVIDDGKVVEYGSYLELMKKKGEYYKLYQIQAEALKYVGIG